MYRCVRSGSAWRASVGQRSEVERLEDLHVRRNVLAAYCKLIVHGVLEMGMAAEVLMQYVKVTVHPASTLNPRLPCVGTRLSPSFLKGFPLVLRSTTDHSANYCRQNEPVVN